MNTYIYMRILIQLERERRNLILGGAGEARRVRDVARRKRCRIVGEVNAPSSTSYHYSLSLLHLSFSDRDLISLSRYCLFLLLLSSNWLYWSRLWLLFYFFGVWFFVLLFSVGPCGFNNIYMGPNRLHWAGPVLFLIRLPNFGVPTYWLTPRDGKNVPTCLICYVLLWSNVRVT